jgi:hypothetical protein
LKEEKKMVSGGLGEKMKATGGVAFSGFFFCRGAVSGLLMGGASLLFGRVG